MRYLALLPLLFACHSNDAACIAYVDLLAECYPEQWGEHDPVDACQYISVDNLGRSPDKRRGIRTDAHKWECVMHYACEVQDPSGWPGFNECDGGQLRVRHH